MSLVIDIDVSGMDGTEVSALRKRLDDTAGLHRHIAQGALLFVRGPLARYASTQHKSADTLGAKRTGHLEQAYAGIEEESDAESARLLVPRASRLRAAFGAYTASPKNGSKYLTIPVHKDAYGKRAGEMGDLIFLRVGTRKTPILARKDEDGNLTTMYFLTTSVSIEEDPKLLPFGQIADEALDLAEEYALGKKAGGAA